MSSAGSRGDSVLNNRNYRTSIPPQGGAKDIPRVCSECPNPDLMFLADGLSDAILKLHLVAKALKLTAILSNRFLYKSATLELELCSVVPEKVYQFRAMSLKRSFVLDSEVYKTIVSVLK